MEIQWTNNDAPVEVLVVITIAPTTNKKKRKKRKRPRLPPKIRKIVKAKNKKAISLAKANDLRGAAKMFEEVVDLSPNDSQYLNNLAVTYMRLKLYHLAEQILRRARKAKAKE